MNSLALIEIGKDWYFEKRGDRISGLSCLRKHETCFAVYHSKFWAYKNDFIHKCDCDRTDRVYSRTEKILKLPSFDTTVVKI